MIITQTPFRISFFGGGTDYPEWFLDNGGSTIVTTIDKYCYLSVRSLPPFFECKHRIVYGRQEAAWKASDIKHPVVRALLTEQGDDEGLEILHTGDLPARAGIGSSSSFTLGLINALKERRGKSMSRVELALESIRIEREILKETVGWQDQVIASFGGFNRLDFNKDRTFSVTPIPIAHDRKESLQKHLLLFFTRVQRQASEIAKTQVDNFPYRQKELREIKQTADDGLEILTNSSRPLESFGELLDYAWKRKKSLSECVTSPKIDEIYQRGRAVGAIGGKLLGAGGGGFFMFFAKPERHQEIIGALSDLVHVPVRFSDHGSRVIFHNPSLGSSG